MNIEIDDYVAAALAYKVMAQDYSYLLTSLYEEAEEGDFDKLVNAYQLVLKYSTTEQERVELGLSF